MQIMDSKQFCELAGITKMTLHNWINAGYLDRKYFSGRILYFTNADLKKVKGIRKKTHRNLSTRSKGKNAKKNTTRTS